MMNYQYSDAIKYFILYWDDVLGNHFGLNRMLRTFNPRIIIKELMDEIKFNKLRNEDNKKFFKRIIGEYLKNDPGCQGALKIPMTSIIKEFDTVGMRPQYMPNLCEEAIKYFTDFTYFEECIAALLQMSRSEIGELEKGKIKFIAENIIVELREIGYSDDDLKKVPDRLFSNFNFDIEHRVWGFPHGIFIEGIDDPDRDKDFIDKLKNFQDSLTEADRIHALVSLAKIELKNIKYVFKVNGLSCNQILKIGEVTFYNPHLDKMITVEDAEIFDFDEKFGMQNTAECVNASVSVSAVSEAAGLSRAREIVEGEFAGLRFSFGGGLPLWIGRSYIAIGDDGNGSASNHTFERDGDDWTKTCKISENSIEQGLVEVGRFEIARKCATIAGWGRIFNEASHWIKKGDESFSHVDKLLSYWICIETLCAKDVDVESNWFETKGGKSESEIFIIREVVGKLRAVVDSYDSGWKMHRQLSSRFFQAKYKIPEDLLRSAQLKSLPGDRILLSNLIDNCGEIEKYIGNEILVEQIRELSRFYNDKACARSILRSRLEIARDEILLLYRMRNKIAHDGNSNHPSLPALCATAAAFAHMLFRGLVNDCNKVGAKPLSNLLISRVQGFERIETRLEHEDPKIVFLAEYI